MHCVPDEIIEGEHPVRFDADTAEHGDDCILELVERIVKVVDGGGVKVELLFKLAERLFQRFLVLIYDVVLEGADECLQMGLK